jgi:outer membrane protein assembly factor BamB
VGVGRVAVIDLGEIPAEQTVDESPAGPWLHRRWTLVVLALGLALATVAGSAGAPRPLPVAALAARAGSTIYVAGDRLIVVERDNVGIYRHVAAYRLADLARLWRVEMPPIGEAYPIVAADGSLVLTGQPPEGGLHVIGLNAATGAVRWRHQAILDGATSGGLILLASERPDPGAAPAAEPGATGETVRAVNAATGAEVWSVDLPARAMRSYGFDGDYLTVLAVTLPTGRVELRDVDTGNVLRSRSIQWRPADGSRRYAEIVGDLLLVTEESTIAAYELDRLDLRWRMPFEMAHFTWPTQCGAAVCLLRDGGALVVVDTSTGRRKWLDPRWSSLLAEVDGYLIASSERADERSVAALDPDTGQVRRDLGRWHEVHSTGADNPVIGIRYEPTRTLVARLDPASGSRIIGVLHDTLNRSCWTQSSLLLCWRTGNRLGIWHLPA